MGDYLYLSQQSAEHFEAHNRNDLDFIELNPLSSYLICFSLEEQSTTFEQQPPEFEYLNYQIHIWIAAHQSAETFFETEEESYQTAPIFDFFPSDSDHSTQTVTPEPMAQDPMQANILATFQGIQTALGQKNNTLLSLFRGDAQNPIEWLDDFKKAATAN
ncbi:hypothetical protein G9A89_022173 [Geosiphon pyriformis]|nr:hypothetical protein G9A89_022173 [Geosiphon pyriformis]